MNYHITAFERRDEYHELCIRGNLLYETDRGTHIFLRHQELNGVFRLLINLLTVILHLKFKEAAANVIH